MSLDQRWRYSVETAGESGPRNNVAIVGIPSASFELKNTVELKSNSNSDKPLSPLIAQQEISKRH